MQIALVAAFVALVTSAAAVAQTKPAAAPPAAPPAAVSPAAAGTAMKPGRWELTTVVETAGRIVGRR